MVLFTLRKMAEGGMHDHLGGGFHRYSVDERWHVPHFEKMLYDQGQLAATYLDAYQITHEAFFAETARDILDYVRRDLTGAEGQFYSAEDADSPVPADPQEHAEGAFYVWEQSEIAGILGPRLAEIFGFHYGVEQEGNASGDAQGELDGKNVLIVTHSVEETAGRFGLSAEAVRDELAEARRRLFEARAERPRPQVDDKTIAAWNGLMISALRPRLPGAGRRDSTWRRPGPPRTSSGGSSTTRRAASCSAAIARAMPASRAIWTTTPS